MKVIGIIPARYESSRLPGKPLADICGRPMVWWPYVRAKTIEELDEVYIATDDERIVEVCKEYNLNVIMTSKEHKNGTERLSEVAKKIEADIYVPAAAAAGKPRSRPARYAGFLRPSAGARRH